MSKIIFGLIYTCCLMAFGQTNVSPNNKNPNLNNIQPIIVIDGSKLINPPKNNSQTNTPNVAPTTASKTDTAPLENNVRIGSNGQFLDNAKTEQINSKGQICTTTSGKKTCN